LAADERISALARQLKAAGVLGGLDQLRARAYLALLLGQTMPGLGPPAPSGLGPPGPSGFGPPGPYSSFPEPLAGGVNLTMPLATWLGASPAPGEVAGFGPVAAGDGRALAEHLAREPGSRWCLTLTGAGGVAVAHGCGRIRWDASSGTGKGRSTRTGSSAGTGGWVLTATIRPLAVGSCDHERESPSYRPPPALRHLIAIRQRTCSFPGCRRPAARCDQDHTVPHHLGGRTCECNLAPLCRRHHQAKQAQGWRLEQPEPGVLVWTLPHGRSYRVGPDPHSPESTHDPDDP
jgi:hypothetical protein